jgi:hypothetical protein
MLNLSHKYHKCQGEDNPKCVGEPNVRREIPEQLMYKE